MNGLVPHFGEASTYEVLSGRVTNVAGFEPMFFVLVHGGCVLGCGFGFLPGALSMFCGAGCLPRRRGRAEIAMLAAYGAVAAFAYGWMQNLGLWPFVSGMSSSISYQPDASVAGNLGRFVAFSLATSLGFDVPRAAFTALLVAVTGRPVLLAPRRAARRAAFGAPARFDSAE